MTNRFARMLFVSCVLTALDLPARVNSWTTNGPEGAIVSVIAIAPSEPGTAYTLASGAVFKSIDAGLNWKAARNGLENRSITHLAVDPANAAVVYAASSEGVFLTADAGQTWRPLPGLPAPLTGLAVDLTRAATIYAVASGVLYRSADRGETWRGVLSKPVLPNRATSLRIHPSTGAIHANIASDFLYSSADGGETWIAHTLPPQYGLTLDPVAPSTMYVYGNSGIFKTSDGGKSWIRINDRTLPYDGDMGVYFLDDLIVDPSSPSTLYIVANGEVCKSINSGVTWTTLKTGSPARVWSLAVDPSAEGTVYAGTYGDGIFKTMSGGDRWNPMGRGLRGALVRGLLRTNAAEPSAVVAGTAGGLHQSLDGGASWHRLSAPIDATFVAGDPSNGEIIYAGSQSRLLRSIDGGGTWSLLRDVGFYDYLLTLVVDPANPATLYLGSGRAVLKSIDRGDTWSEAMGGLPTNVAAFSTMAIDRSGAIYAGTTGQGMYKSTTGGADWSPIGSGLPSHANGVELLETDPYDASIYTAVRGRGLFRSVDGGRTWQSIGLSNQSVTNLLIDPKSSSWYAGTSSGEVFTSVDSGEHWTSMNEGHPLSFVTSLALDAGGKILHAGTNGGGVFEYEIASPLAIPIQKLPDDPARVPRLLAAMATERSARVASSRLADLSSKAFLIAAAASTAGANGTFFRSDVTLINRSDHEQHVVVAWLPAAEEAQPTPTFRITLPARGGQYGWIASPPPTIADFVRVLGLSGVGSLLFIAVDSSDNLAGDEASITGLLRIWTLGPDGKGTMSQSFGVVDPLDLDLEPHAMAAGFRHDGSFRTNLGIVNLDTQTRTFDCRIVGETALTSISVRVPGLSMKQIPVPQGSYGMLAIEIWAEHSEEGIAALHYPWMAYGSTVDNATGDSWASVASGARP